MNDRKLVVAAFAVATAAATIVVAGCAGSGSAPTATLDRSDLMFITPRFGLEPLPGVRAGAGDLTAAFAP